MKKKILSLILAVILCIQALSVRSFAVEDAGSPKHIPRVVSVVFDDSGSMYKDTDRWAYTSYAMQSFAAMMGSEDVLYITYLNGPAGTVKVDLSGGAKNSTVSNFSKIMFGGGTPNKVTQGVECLTREYASYKTNAKYYLVVMSDGELDSGLGKLSDKIASAAASTKTALAGADFETIYFAMNSANQSAITGATSYFAASSDEIVSTLKDVSADIMGRTAVTHSVSGDKLTFTMQYPALSIAVFAQKKNGDFKDFRASVQKDGKAASCQVENYSIQCPTEIIKNTNDTVFQEKIPQNPPAGVVSLITNGGNPLAKGTYTIDLSGYELQNNDVVVLVEPAVRIGCKYVLNDDDSEITFEELKKRVAEGDTVTVVCGLYEMKADGSAGEAIALDVLSPDYKILVNGKQVGTPSGNGTHAYSFKVDKSFENQQMRVVASLKGYQPFVMKETFGKLNIRIEIPNQSDKNEITLTKPVWKKWSAGQEGISFQLEKVDDSVLQRVAISTEGIEGLPAGICSALGNAVRVEGNTIVYLPKVQNDFGALPDTFKINLVNLETAKPVITKNVKVVRPTYRFEVHNPLANEILSLDLLKTNTSAVTFTLTVDYEGDGKYIPVSSSDCEGAITLKAETGVLPGKVTQEQGKILFVPKYDPAVDTQLTTGDFVGKNHSLFATAEVDGQKIQSEKTALSFVSANYRLEVENEITEQLSLDTIKTNQKKVIFKLLAAYDGSSTFGELAQWDTAALERLTIDAGGLPGKTETVYDAGGKAVGKAFIPQYDENNNGGIPFTAVAGKTHEIIGSLTGTDQRATASVEVLAPDYDLFVYKENIVITDVKLRKNTESVAFTVQRDGRNLTKQELENLSTYKLGFDKKQSWIKLEAQVKVAEDGTAYLECTPKYGGWRFPAWWCWNWLCLFTVDKGDMHITLTMGEEVASAALKVVTSKAAWIAFFVSLALLLLIAWIVFCCATRVRFLSGVFYRVSFRRGSNTLGYVVSTRIPQNANKKSLLRHLLSGKFMKPFCEQSVSIVVGRKPAVFKAEKSPVKTFSCRSVPYSVGEKNRHHFNKGHLSKANIRAILNGDPDFVLEQELMTGTPCSDDNKKLDSGTYLVEKGGNNIIFFLTKSEEKEIKASKYGRSRQKQKNNRGGNAAKKKTTQKRKKYTI